MPKVSVIIVCMNNLGNLFPCLDSIKKHTSISYEVIVIAYLFSEENKQLLREKYSWVKIIESDEIRGFSENNNLGLRQAVGKYCFVLNDDTLMNEPVIDKLVESFNSVPENTAIVSPVLVGLDGKVQVCGRPRIDWKRFVLGQFHLWNEKKKSKYTNGKGLFQTYNIIGAAFLIKTEVFKEMGWFDEYYFFCPEDIALSTKLNENGYKCYVNADAKIVHLEGMSGKSLSMIKTATRPAGNIGSIKFYSNSNKILQFFLLILTFSILSIKCIYHGIKSIGVDKPNYNYILYIGELNTLRVLFSRQTPKTIFINYYHKISKANKA